MLYNDSLEFDSDELDLLKFDWEDVQQVICHEPQSVRMEDPDTQGYNVLDLNGQTTTAVGILRIDGDRIFVNTGEETVEFDRSSLVSIAPGKSRELDYWAAKLTLSLDVSQGNSEQLNYSSYAEAKRRTSRSLFYIDHRGIYTTTSGLVTGNSQRATSSFDIFSTRRFFWRPVFAEYFRDLFANIANRSTVGAGLGYTIIDTAKTRLLISPGVAYLATHYESVEPGEDDVFSTPALVVTTEFDTEVTSKIDFNAKYQFNVVNEESGTYTHHASAVLEIEITGKLDLDLSVIWDRIQDPTADSDGIVPKQDDLYFFWGISFEL